MRPIFQESVSVYIEGESTFHFLSGNLGLQKTFEGDDSFRALIQLLDGSHTLEQLVQILTGQFPHLSADDIVAAVQELESEQILYDLELAPVPGWFTDEELNRYAKQVLLWGDLVTYERRHSIQKRLKDSRVTLIGLGGTGSWCAWALAQAGVGALQLCDFDVVERSNLNRQGLYRESDIGVEKVTAAAQHIRALNHNVVVETRRLILEEETGLQPVLQNADMVINCTDHPTVYQTGIWVARACMPLGLPHIVGGGYNTHIGKIGSTILPFETACWMCFAKAAADPRLDGTWQVLVDRSQSYHGGNTGTIAAIIANMQAWDAIRVLGGIGEPLLANRMGEFDFTTLDVRWKSVPRNPDCPLCGSAFSPTLVASGRDDQ